MSNTALPSAFNANDGGEEMSERKLYDAGEYNVQVTESEVKLTKKAEEANNPALGQRLALTMTFLDGPYVGQKFFRGLNIVNPNQTAVEISQKELRTLCKACGKGAISDSTELHGIPFTMKLKIKPETASRQAENEVVTYKTLGASAPAPVASSTAAAPAAEPAAATGKKAWEQ